MLLSPLGSAAGCLVQSWVDEGRGSVSPAFTHFWPTSSPAPLVPSLPGHSFYMVTPGGSSGITRQDAICDIMSMSSWLVAAISVTPGGRQHVHYMALIPNDCARQLHLHPLCIWRGGRRLPQVVYDRGGTMEPCNVVFSEAFSDGIFEYLGGSENRATFVTLLDASASMRPRRRDPVRAARTRVGISSTLEESAPCLKEAAERRDEAGVFWSESTTNNRRHIAPPTRNDDRPSKGPVLSQRAVVITSHQQSHLKETLPVMICGHAGNG